MSSKLKALVHCSTLQDPSGCRDGDRPKAEGYFASYRLPGAPSGHSTTAKTLTAGAGKAAAAAGLAGRAWSAKLGHVGSFQVGCCSSCTCLCSLHLGCSARLHLVREWQATYSSYDNNMRPLWHALLC